MESYYFGKIFGILHTDKSTYPEKGIFGVFPEKYAKMIFKGKNPEELKTDMIKKLTQKQITLQSEANEIEELTLKIKENGLEKTSQYYNTLEENQ